jgi:hypothetical protein
VTEGFQTVLAAGDRDRRDLFVGAGNRLGTAEQNIEKDFWVGHIDEAFDLLEQAVKGRDGILMFLTTERTIEGIRNDPRYSKVLDSMNLIRFERPSLRGS